MDRDATLPFLFEVLSLPGWHSAFVGWMRSHAAKLGQCLSPERETEDDWSVSVQCFFQWWYNYRYDKKDWKGLERYGSNSYCQHLSRLSQDLSNIRMFCCQDLPDLGLPSNGKSGRTGRRKASNKAETRQSWSGWTRRSGVQNPGRVMILGKVNSEYATC